MGNYTGFDGWQEKRDIRTDRVCFPQKCCHIYRLGNSSTVISPHSSIFTVPRIYCSLATFSQWALLLKFTAFSPLGVFSREPPNDRSSQWDHKTSQLCKRQIDKPAQIVFKVATELPYGSSVLCTWERALRNTRLSKPHAQGARPPL